MKRILLFMVTMLTFTFVKANSVRVTLISGQNFSGEYVSMSDSVLQFVNKGTGKTMSIIAPHVTYVSIEGIGEFVVNNDKFVSKKEYKLLQKERDQKDPAALAIKEEISKNKQLANNPYYRVGKILKNTGSVSLGIGVPCLAVGVATCVAGHIGKKSASKARCAEASYYMLGTGAALTIVGFPLYVQGKKIMDLSVNYTGNGVGMAINF